METPQPKPALPVCPHCGADPARFSQALVKLNEHVTAVAIYCSQPTCRKLHTVQIMSVDAPQVVPAARMPAGLPKLALARG